MLTVFSGFNSKFLNMCIQNQQCSYSAKAVTNIYGLSVPKNSITTAVVVAPPNMAPTVTKDRIDISPIPEIP